MHRPAHSLRFAEIYIASLATTFFVGYQFASRRQTALQVLGLGAPSLRRGSLRPVLPLPRTGRPLLQGLIATAPDRRSSAARWIGDVPIVEHKQDGDLLHDL